jgi:beta-lactam-binding protein with PASTA domain
VRSPGWLTVALAGAGGFFVGVILVIVLGGPADGPTRTVTQIAHSLTTGVDVVVKVRVPPVEGLELDDAQSRLKAAGFAVKVDGKSFLDELFGNPTYRVTKQTPGPTVFMRRGATVQLQVSS